MYLYTYIHVYLCTFNLLHEIDTPGCVLANSGLSRACRDRGGVYQAGIKTQLRKLPINGTRHPWGHPRTSQQSPLVLSRSQVITSEAKWPNIAKAALLPYFCFYGMLWRCEDVSGCQTAQGLPKNRQRTLLGRGNKIMHRLCSYPPSVK